MCKLGDICQIFGCVEGASKRCLVIMSGCGPELLERIMNV